MWAWTGAIQTACGRLALGASAEGAGTHQLLAGACPRRRSRTVFGPPKALEKPLTLHWSPRPLEALKVLQPHL